jgi:hypothetical protein
MGGRRRNGGPPSSSASPGPRTGGRPAYSATAGLPFDDEELESKLVWIWGSPRTGSTWLLEMLCHPLKVNQEQPLGFSWPESFRGRAPALPVDEFLISWHLVPSQGRTLEIDEELRPGTLNRFLGHHPSYAFSREFAEVWRPEARRLTLVRLNAIIERARDAGLDLATRTPFLVIKEVNGSYAADEIMSLFPRSRMVLMVRDGRDVLDSYTDANAPGGWLDGYLATNPLRDADNRLAWMREVCRNWVAGLDVCTKAFEAHDPDLRRQVRYEELLDDTPGILGDLLGWIGLRAGERRVDTVTGRHSFAALPEAKKGAGKHHRSATPGRWREGLTAEEQELAHEIMGERLVELGYENSAEPV